MIQQSLPGFKLDFTSRRVSSFSGLSLVALTGERLGVWDDIDRQVRLKERRRGHTTSEVVMDMALLMVAGGECLDDLEMLRRDAALGKLLGRERFLAPTTAGQTLRRFGPLSLEALGEVNRRLVGNVARRCSLDVATVDVDSTVIEAEKEQCRRTYTGERGYNPLFGFWAEANLVVADLFRPGNASPAADALEFLRECVGALPPWVRRIRFRSDSAWYNHAVMDHCEREGYGFMVTAVMTEAVGDVIAAIEEPLWEPLEDGQQMAETVHALEGSPYSYRLIVLRRERTQMDLFEGCYSYHAIITNMEGEASELVHFHRGRAQSENRIKELKLGLGLRRLPCGQLLANAAWVRIGALAYNLVEAMRRFALPSGWRRFTLKTLRFRLLRVAGLVVHHARQMILRLPLGYPHLGAFERAHLRLRYAPI